MRVCAAKDRGEPRNGKLRVSGSDVGPAASSDLVSRAPDLTPTEAVDLVSTIGMSRERIVLSFGYA